MVGISCMLSAALATVGVFGPTWLVKTSKNLASNSSKKEREKQWQITLKFA
jgi:hypothetical protein